MNKLYYMTCEIQNKVTLQWIFDFFAQNEIYMLLAVKKNKNILLRTCFVDNFARFSVGISAT